jgi:hypothetical protein
MDKRRHRRRKARARPNVHSVQGTLLVHPEKRPVVNLRTLALLAAALLVPLSTVLGCKKVGAQEVVVHPGLAMGAVDLPELRAIFGMGVSEWSNGSGVSVFVMDPSSQLHISFVKNVLRIFPYQLSQAWDRLIFSGTGQAPTVVRSIQEMHGRVAETPGAIGYLPTDHIDDRVRRLEVVK